MHFRRCLRDKLQLPTFTQKQLAPEEDQSAIFISATAPEYANIDYVTKFTKQLETIMKNLPQTEDYFVINGMDTVNSVIAGNILKPWNERSVKEQQLVPVLQEKISKIAGMQTVAFPLPSLPGSGGGLPVQFVLNTTGSYAQLLQVSNNLLKKAQASGMFMFVQNTLKF
ncbi:MAG: multidrug efflux protein, partial [Candidatus Latescibacteria bacterium]|nr:multidrug efflux protein [Candidatus Latescibacterota bacterium]